MQTLGHNSNECMSSSPLTPNNIFPPAMDASHFLTLFDPSVPRNMLVPLINGGHRQLIMQMMRNRDYYTPR